MFVDEKKSRHSVRAICKSTRYEEARCNKDKTSPYAFEFGLNLQ
jgi:hypothetical protein